MSNSILFISAFPPNSKTAGQNYSQLLLDDLVSQGYHIDLVYFSFPGHRIEVNKNVRILKAFDSSVKNILCTFFPYPLFSKRFKKNILSYLNSIAQNYDVLYFDFSQVHLYSKYISHPFKILMCHDVIYQKTKRQLPFLLLWEKLTESIILKTARLILTFSEKDCLLVKKIYGLDSFAVNFYLKNRMPSFLPPVQNDTFCFYGAWNRRENYEILDWFRKKVLPDITRNFCYKIIGGGMSDSLKEKLSSDSRFEILGFVENPVLELAKCQALIAPLLHGAGVKVKVIDALTSGTKVIGSSVAFEGLCHISAAQLFYECRSPHDFAAVLNSWQNDCAQTKLASAKEFFAYYNTNHFPALLAEFSFSAKSTVQET